MTDHQFEEDDRFRTESPDETRARALFFDLSFYADYRFSQVCRVFKQTAMWDDFIKTEM